MFDGGKAMADNRQCLNPANIPSSLKAWPNWVCWKEAIRNGEPTKPPVDVRTGRFAEADNPDTWNTFEDTLAYYQAHSNNGIRGIGFELGKPKNTAFVGIGVDALHIRQATKKFAGFGSSFVSLPWHAHHNCQG